MTSKYPGEKSAAMLSELQKYVLVEPYPFVLDLEKCDGMYMATIDGQRLFDWAGYYASKLLGHNHPRLLEPAYQKQLALAANNKLANPDFLTPQCLEYYKLIHSLAPECMQNPKLEVYTVNSGAEAVENMMKYFINLHKEKHLAKGVAPATRRFVYFDQAFHGRTVFALNVTQITHDLIITKDFHGFIPGNIQVPFPAVDNDMSREHNDAISARSLDIIETFLKHYTTEVVGIIVEPLQGAGGHRAATPEFFQQLSSLAHKYDVYLGFDEVQTAGGQLGTMFAADTLHLPYPPDAIATAKKFGNGVVYMMHPMTDLGVLDSTWGGNLADMVRFTQEMKIVRDEKLIEAVPSKTAHLLNGLQSLQTKYKTLIKNIRGIGLYQGFSLIKPAHKAKLVELALEQEDMFLLGAGTDSIRLRPVLNVTTKDIDLLIKKLDNCLAML